MGSKLVLAYLQVLKVCHGCIWGPPGKVSRTFRLAHLGPLDFRPLKIDKVLLLTHSAPKMEAHSGTKMDAHSAPKMEANSGIKMEAHIATKMKAHSAPNA